MICFKKICVICVICERNNYKVIVICLNLTVLEYLWSVFFLADLANYADFDAKIKKIIIFLNSLMILI